MTDHRFESIPPGRDYDGMVKVRIGETERCVQVYGWGAEAERRAEQLARKITGEGVDE
jgi:hypothetical protein